MNTWFVILNPTAGSGKAEKDWPKIEAQLKRARFDFDLHKTARQGHAAELVKEGISKGYRKFLCVGGDGTLHHAMNGIMQQEEISSTEPTLAMIPVGTGNDWVRTYGIPTNYEETIRGIKLGKPFIQDVGLATFGDQKEERYFINFAGAGFDGYVVKNAGKRFGKLSYLWGLATCLFSFKTPSLHVEVNDENRQGKFYMTIAGIGQYGGGGMRLMPNAITNDGLLDLTLAGDLSKMDVVSNLGKIFSGKLLSHPKVESIRCKQIIIQPLDDQECWMEADGELLGQGPFEIKIIPSALRVLVPDHNFKD